MEYRVAKEYFMNYLKSYAAIDTTKYYEWSLYSFEQYLIHFRHCDYMLDYDVNRINDVLIQSYIAYKRETIKNVSIRTYMRAIKSFINYCNTYQGTSIHVHVKLPKDDSKLKLPLTQHEFLKLLKACEGDMYVRDTLILFTMLNCGLRLQEIIDLKVRNINFEDCIIIVNNSKNNKSRIVPMPLELSNRFKSYFANRYATSIWAFVTDDNRKITKHVLENLFAKLKKEVPRVHPHLLRHTFATSYIMGGGSLEYLRCILGHTSYSTTQNYISMAT